MTEQPQTPATAAPAAGQQPAQAPSRPASPAPSQQDAPQEPASEGLSADEQAELGQLLAKRDAAVAGPDPVRLKVEPPHASISFGGVTVASEFTSVPASIAAAVTGAAAEAGVKITQET